MIKKNKIVLLAIWMFTCSIRPNPIHKGVFGVKVSLQGTGQMYFIHAFINNGRTLTNQKLLNLDEFTKFASGYWPSIYNPERRNFLLENKLQCGILESENRIKQSYCSPFDSIWKIRYSFFPYSTNSENGWAKGNFNPSENQLNYLFERYQVKNLDVHYFIDDKFWLILKDIQNPEWVTFYKNL